MPLTRLAVPQHQLYHIDPLRAAIVTVPASVFRRNLKLVCLLGVAVLLVLASYQSASGGGRILYLDRLASEAKELQANDSGPTVAPPLTTLGYEADLVYEAVGSTDQNVYRSELESFLYRSFPARESNETDPESLISILHEYLPPPPMLPRHHPQTAFRRLLLLPSQLVFMGVKGLLWPSPAPAPVPRPPRNIPERIHQTSWFPGTMPPADKLPPQTWRNLNPGYQYTYYDNEAAEAFMIDRFNQSTLDATRRRPGYSLSDTYLKMQDVPVTQSDFWRYAILASEGGVYSAQGQLD